MKKIIAALLVLSSCTIKPEPECLKSHLENVYDWHYGLNVFNGKLEWHLGPHLVEVCDSIKTDTTQTNQSLIQ